MPFVEKHFEETITVPCDDDHFSSSETEVQFAGRGVDGVFLKVKPQLGAQDTVFLHAGQITLLIKALEKAKRLIAKHGRVAREGGFVCKACTFGPCYETRDWMLDIRCKKASRYWQKTDKVKPKVVATVVLK